MQKNQAFSLDRVDHRRFAFRYRLPRGVLAPGQERPARYRRAELVLHEGIRTGAVEQNPRWHCI
jgi:hypothetical protein